VLREARLVTTRREGKHVYYRMADDSVCRLLQAVQEVARAQLSEVSETVRTHFEVGTRSSRSVSGSSAPDRGR
jgi:DNA-binding transcriptional ArsR family regulator